MNKEFYDDWLAIAAQYVASDISLDMCRHESITEPTFWLFRNGKQIGAVAADNGEWRATRLFNGMAAGVRREAEIAEAFAYVDGFVVRM